MTRNRRSVSDSTIACDTNTSSFVRSRRSRLNPSFKKLLDLGKPAVAYKNPVLPKYESCVIDGFSFFSFPTAEDQQIFSLLSTSELAKMSLPNSHPVFTNIAEKKGNEHGKDDYEKEMKQVELPEQFLWAQSDELRVQISIEKIENNRTRIPIPKRIRTKCSILEKFCSVPILNPGKESEQTSTYEEDSTQTQIPNPVNEDIIFVNCGTSNLEENTDMGRPRRKTCNLCGQTFAFEFSLEIHLRSIIPKNPKKLFCEFCSHFCLSSETMRMHTKQLHGKKLFDMYNGEDCLKELCGGTVPACEPCF